MESSKEQPVQMSSLFKCHLAVFFFKNSFKKPNMRKSPVTIAKQLRCTKSRFNSYPLSLPSPPLPSFPPPPPIDLMVLKMCALGLFVGKTAKSKMAAVVESSPERSEVFAKQVLACYRDILTSLDRQRSVFVFTLKWRRSQGNLKHIV